MKPLFLFALLLTGCADQSVIATPPAPVDEVSAFCGNSTTGDAFTGTGSTYNLFLANGNEVKIQSVDQAKGLLLP